MGFLGSLGSVLGSIVGGGAGSVIGSGLGGYADWRQQEMTNKRNLETQERINMQNLANSKEFAKNSIQWRVQDAKAAGLHPLYALGAPTMSPPTMRAGQEHYGGGLGKSLSSMGQLLDIKFKKEQVESAKLDNALKKKQISTLSLGGRDNWLLNPNYSPSSKVGDNYSDLVENLYGMFVKLPADAKYNLEKKIDERKFKNATPGTFDAKKGVCKKGYSYYRGDCIPYLKVEKRYGD